MEMQAELCPGSWEASEARELLGRVCVLTRSRRVLTDIWDLNSGYMAPAGTLCTVGESFDLGSPGDPVERYVVILELATGLQFNAVDREEFSEYFELPAASERVRTIHYANYLKRVRGGN